ncbi:hypothetical protein [Pedobacter sp.]|uniref:hypothetical protein n=1 Tax=Pedobacter sp. TaxID=1411316 RepID=UPI00396C4814
MYENISPKSIIGAIEEYYNGLQIEQICDKYQINKDIFTDWLANYKDVALDFMNLKLENEKLRTMYVNLLLTTQASPDDKI